MAFISNNNGNGTSDKTSAKFSEIKKEYEIKSDSYSKISEEILMCDKTTCQFNIEEGKCSLEFCFYDDTEWKLSKDTFKFKCQICDTESVGDSKNPDMRICKHCLNRMKQMGTLKNCILCGGGMDPKTAKLWLTGICDSCIPKLRKAIQCTHRH